MKTSDDLSTISVMATFGGRFAQALAQAALAADDENLAKVKATWPELWHKYATWLNKAEPEGEVRRWNRVLSDEEIAALYKLGPTGVEVQPKQAGQL